MGRVLPTEVRNIHTQNSWGLRGQNAAIARKGVGQLHAFCVKIKSPYSEKLLMVVYNSVEQCFSIGSTRTIGGRRMVA